MHINNTLGLNVSEFKSPSSFVGSKQRGRLLIRVKLRCATSRRVVMIFALRIGTATELTAAVSR